MQEAVSPTFHNDPKKICKDVNDPDPNSCAVNAFPAHELSAIYTRARYGARRTTPGGAASERRGRSPRKIQCFDSAQASVAMENCIFFDALRFSCSN